MYHLIPLQLLVPTQYSARAVQIMTETMTVTLAMPMK